MEITEVEAMLSDKFYTVQELSELFQVTKPTVVDWLTSGDYKYLKVGTRYRIPKATVMQMAQAMIKTGKPNHKPDKNAKKKGK